MTRSSLYNNRKLAPKNTFVLCLFFHHSHLLMKYRIPAFLCLTGILLLTGCCQRKEITTSSQFFAENKTSTGTDHFPTYSLLEGEFHQAGEIRHTAPLRSQLNQISKT